MRVRALRQRDPLSEPYWETFDYDGPENNTVARLLDYLNYNDDIVTTAGESHANRLGVFLSARHVRIVLDGDQRRPRVGVRDLSY